MANTTEVASDAALATANWWADKVFGSTMGDAGPGTGMTMALAVVAGAQGVAAPDSKREQFVERLSVHVNRFLEPNGDRPGSLCLAVDYGPEPPLSNIAADLGIPGGSFPWKTMTWTHPTHVVAALGYGASGSLVWQADGWERPACGQGQYGDEEREPWKCSAPRYHEGGHVFDTPDPLCQADLGSDGWPTGRCLRPVGHEWHRDDSYRTHEFTA